MGDVPTARLSARCCSGRHLVRRVSISQSNHNIQMSVDIFVSCCVSHRLYNLIIPTKVVDDIGQLLPRRREPSRTLSIMMIQSVLSEMGSLPVMRISPTCTGSTFRKAIHRRIRRQMKNSGQADRALHRTPCTMTGLVISFISIWLKARPT
jgi:hypothetical protein